MCPLCVPAAKNAATCHQQPALSSGHTTKHRHVPRFSAIDAMDTASPDRMDELTCAICLNLLCEPVLWPAADDATACRHVFCRHCIVRCTFSPSGKSCPLCRAPASSVCVEDLPIEVDVQRQVMEFFPSEHAVRQAEVAKEASDVHQVLLHTVDSNPWNLRPRKGSYFRLWLRSTDETLLTQRAY